MNVWLYSLVSVIIVSVLSLVGIVTLALSDRILRKILSLLVSLAAGAMLGDAFFHLLPEAVSRAGALDVNLSLYVLVGILLFFILEKAILWHHCHLDHTGECKHDVKSFGTMNLIGDAFHNFLDGLVIGASYVVSFGLGLTTTLAVIFHEIPQEIGDFGVLVASGRSKGRALLLNFVTAATAIVGAIIAVAISVKTASVTVFLVPFTAGGFIYIAASDLIPYLQSQDTRLLRTVSELVFFVLGVALMWALLFLE